MAPDVLPSPHQSPPLPSPAAHPDAAAPPLPSRPNDKPTPHSSPSPPPAAIVAVSSHAARYNPPRRSTPVAAPALAAAGGRGGDWFSWSGRNSQPPQQQRQPPPPPPPPPANRVVSDIVSRDRRAAALQRAELAARAAGACLCLAALSVLAADRRKGWALDSYSNYTQFRYSETVNVIGFLYSIFQFYALAEYMRKKKHVIPRPKGNYFDFAMDQVLAYLLISSSSSATARVGDWIDNWGSDPFPNMANGSIAISFLAFLVFAASSLISAYNLFRRHL